jgi:hypothetical protein
MNILQSTAEYGKTYYVEYDRAIRQCRLIATHGTYNGEWYTLEVAGVGEVDILLRLPMTLSGGWWYSSKTPSILAESPEDIRNGRFLTDNYGSTDNAYNYEFMKQFLPNYEPCVSGGGITFWAWDGVRAKRHYESKEFPWRIDAKGFHCSINAKSLTDGRYDSKDACEKANQPVVVTF